MGGPSAPVLHDTSVKGLGDAVSFLSSLWLGPLGPGSSALWVGIAMAWAGTHRAGALGLAAPAPGPCSCPLAALSAAVVGGCRRAPGCRPWDPMPVALTPRTPAAGPVLALAADVAGASKGPAERPRGLAQHTGVPLRVQAILSHRAQALGSVALGHCPLCRTLRLCFLGLGAPRGHGGQEAVPGGSPPIMVGG